MGSQGWYVLLVLAVGAERIAELVVAKRNASWSKARGGVETGQSHYPAIVLVHTGLLAGCVVEVLTADRPFIPLLGWPMLVLVLASQALRWWCIRTLGRRWNTKIIVVPGLAPISAGPYRFLRHPNYVAVVVEGLALPLVHTAWITAAVFTILNVPLLALRLHVEEAALATLPSAGTVA
jgi:methyltransferase